MLVDWTRIDVLIDGDDPSDQEWILDMIKTLYKNMDERIENLKTFSESKKSEDLRSELHQIKGVSSNFGLMDLYNSVLSAETKIKEGDLESGIEISQTVPDIWVSTKKELENRYK